MSHHHYLRLSKFLQNRIVNYTYICLKSVEEILRSSRKNPPRCFLSFFSGHQRMMNHTFQQRTKEFAFAYKKSRHFKHLQYKEKETFMSDKSQDSIEYDEQSSRSTSVGRTICSETTNPFIFGSHVSRK